MKINNRTENEKDDVGKTGVVEINLCIIVLVICINYLFKMNSKCINALNAFKKCISSINLGQHKVQSRATTGRVYNSKH